MPPLELVITSRLGWVDSRMETGWKHTSQVKARQSNILQALAKWADWIPNKLCVTASWMAARRRGSNQGRSIVNLCSPLLQSAQQRAFCLSLCKLPSVQLQVRAEAAAVRQGESPAVSGNGPDGSGIGLELNWGWNWVGVPCNEAQ